MRTLITIVVVFTVGLLGFSIYYYMEKWGSLEGEVVIEHLSNDETIAIRDMSVYLLAPDIGPSLDSLEVYYEKNVVLLQDTLTYLQVKVDEYTQRAREEEVIFNVTLSRADPSSRLYRENKKHRDSVVAAKDSVVDIYNDSRKSLLDKQNGYNGVIEQLIKNKLILQAEVGELGEFKFSKLEKGDYYLYALKIFSGEEDITRIPAEMYHIYALSGVSIRKYTWMFKVSVEAESFIQLNNSNTSEIFK
jgi:hypothetical protein